MIYRRLGMAGLKVSLFSLGSWLTFGNQISDDTAEELMNFAYDNGVNFFDNAEVYANGASETVMGNILKKNNWERSSYLVSSKVFWGGKLPNQTGLSRKHVLEACHSALRRLQVDYLDLFFCHRPDPETPISETVWAMHHLISQGKVLYWGTSEWSAEQILEAHKFAIDNNLIPPSMEQPQYNLFYREKVEKELLPLYSKIGLGTTIWSPLASGLLTGKYSNQLQDGSANRLGSDANSWLKNRLLTEENLRKVNLLTHIANDLNLSLAQLALCWCAKNNNVSTVILGASKFEQLRENLQAVNCLNKLDKTVLTQIDEIFTPAESSIKFA